MVLGTSQGSPIPTLHLPVRRKRVVRRGDGIRRHFSGESMGGKKEPLLDIPSLGLITSLLTALSDSHACLGN